jgi:hypothetical protein
MVRDMQRLPCLEDPKGSDVSNGLDIISCRGALALAADVLALATPPAEQHDRPSDREQQATGPAARC